MIPNFDFFHEDTESYLSVGEITIAVGFRCNLQCYGCSTVSNYKMHDPFTLADRLSWIESLGDMLARNNLTIGRMSIGGGEPFITKDTIPLINKIYEVFPKSMMRHSIVSNGLLVRKNLDILDAIQEHNMAFSISMHRTDEEAETEYKKLFELMAARNIKFGTTFTSNTRPWMLQYKTENGKVIPAESDINKSWTVCKSKHWSHISDYKLLKCPKITYLDRMLTHTNQLDDPQWQKYRKYKGIDCRTANLDDVIKFFTAGPEDICGMCSETNVFYNEKPVFQKDYENFNFEDKKVFSFSLNPKNK